MTAMGRSFDFTRGTPIVQGSTPSIYDLPQWNWHTVDESYWKITAAAGNKWILWSPDGTRYEYTIALRWGWKAEAPGQSETFETYKWLLTDIVDPHENRIRFTYNVPVVTVPGVIEGTTENIHPTYHPTAILWGYDGATPGTGTPRYRVDFQVNTRDQAPTTGVDEKWDFAENQAGTNKFSDPPDGTGAPHERYRLNSIVLSAAPPNSGLIPVTRWDFEYYSAPDSVQSDMAGGQKMLTLKRVRRGAYIPGTAGWMYELPWTTFTYQINRGSPDGSQPPVAGWNRLLAATNGYGGRVSFTYAPVWGTGGEGYPPNQSYYEGSPYANRFRVTQMTQDSGLNDAGVALSYNKTIRTTYEYIHPTLNTREQSAMVWYARYPATSNGGNPEEFTGANGSNEGWLVHREETQFRGHGSVIQRVYNGAEANAPLLQRSQTWFYQGQPLGQTCAVPLLTGNSGQYVDMGSDCFKTLLRHEAWKGRAYKEEQQDAAGIVRRRVEHAFDRVELPFYQHNPNGEFRRAGLWRAFNYEYRTTTTVFPESGGESSLSWKTEYYYTYYPECEVTASYALGLTPTSNGNLVCQVEYDQTNTPVRRTEHTYAALNTGSSYIIDRRTATSVRDSSMRLLAHSHRYYDGNNQSFGALGTRGLLTREIAVYNLPDPPQRSVTNLTLNGRDATYSYDNYGNLTGSTTYAGAGWVKYVPNSWQSSAPGNGSEARTTTTAYDTTFHAFPTSSINPLNQTESAGYDYRLGVLTSVTDANNQTTSAEYDLLGRMVKLIKPFDNPAWPTAQMTYEDDERPFRFKLEQREVANQAGVRVSQQFYDGLGRLIQTKQEASTSTTVQNIVVDTEFDGLGQTTRQSQARYVVQGDPAFYQYQAPPTSGVRWTTFSYDLLGRMLKEIAPDGAQTEHHYGTQGGLLYDDVIDANRHRTQRRYDALGRLRNVLELTGNCSPPGVYWPEYACGGAYTDTWAAGVTTTYAYSPLDLLTAVTDAKGNVSTMQYDGLGRKTVHNDLNMGGWFYTYDANNNLATQTDAKQQTITFSYDKLDRPTGKSGPGWTSEYSYDEAFGLGKGRRTSMRTTLGGVQQSYQKWVYDARGRPTSTTVSIAGHADRTFGTEYNSADLVVWHLYPSNEYVAYGYDGAWRPDQLCGTTCYIIGASYTALDQPSLLRFGNGLDQSFSYDVRARLSEQRLYASGTPNPPPQRSYSYDGVGNVTRISEPTKAGPQVFRYDERDRLVSASAIDSSTSSTSVSIKAKGSSLGGVWPTMQLRVNGVAVQSWTVNSANWANYTATLASPVDGDDLVDVHFTNDDYIPGGEDRNLIVESVAVGGQTIPADNRAVSYDIIQVPGGELYDERNLYASDGWMWFTGALRLTERYQYDSIGNLVNKADLAMTYGSTGTGGGSGPHQARSFDGQAANYDSNGNLLSDGLRSYSWDAENRPTSISSPSGAFATESYRYNADGARVRVSSSAETRLYLEGLWEETATGVTRSNYILNGQVVAVREASGGSSTLTYLHTDQLGSVSIATASNGQPIAQQEYDPWGKVRRYAVPRPTITQTKRNFTGQVLDSTGLLHYNARTYDPSTGRFISADTVVPGNASGGMEGVAAKPLTVGFHEPAFLNKLNGENRLGFWFQLSNEQRQQAGSPWGPSNPQALNRYSYVQNNPLKYTDPSGHSVYLSQDEAAFYAGQMRALASALRENASTVNSQAFVEALVSAGLLTSTLGSVFGLGATFNAVLASAAGGITLFGNEFSGWAGELDAFADLIESANGSAGVIISLADKGDAWGDYCAPTCSVTVVNRETGNGGKMEMTRIIGGMLFSDSRVASGSGKRFSKWVAGRACTYSGGNPSAGNWYKGDHRLCQ